MGDIGMGDSTSHMPSVVMSSSGERFAAYPPARHRNGSYKILEQHHSKKEKIRVASVYVSPKKMENTLDAGTWELVLYEKNHHLGGTWLENQYPGVACDIPSHLYTYSFDPNPNRSQFFASGGEIQKYFEDFADKHNTHQYIKCNTKVIEARWDENAGIWNIKLEDVKTGAKWDDWSHVLINGTGVLNSWKWPEIEGLLDFKGPVVHSASWNHEISFEGKTVGIIGTGTSSVQIVPRLQKICEKYLCICAPQHGSRPHLEARQYNFTESDKKKFNEDPEFHLQFRKEIEAEINGLFGLYKAGSELSATMRTLIREELNRRMGPGHDDLKDFIIPKWSPGCRRLSPGDGYLEALVQPNVRPCFSSITKVMPTGLLTADGENHKFDVLVCATGFNVSWKPSFAVINAEGTTLAEDWKESPKRNLVEWNPLTRDRNYRGICHQMIRKMQEEQIRAFEIKQECCEELQTHCNRFHADTVWVEDCRAWFKDNKKGGRVHVWPGSNRYAYLGNGEVNATAAKDVQGLSTYIRNDDSDWNVE
ncbi:putative sterigmatocystin biosynthesis monooxygenase [Lachnellula subtilissima]|uniref:Putative sterigmatocystin biosynthesis monooxygenase n=1 Tax=Lachnellula subtilissima TaxID=602034 RepID=A0A8H8RPH8_9HELO|nr:putative sterigmatocystin biosynthesis monooxygenase [Lachnellula subtilissima]